MNKPKLGDLIAIPCNERWGLAKIIFLSKRYKDVIHIKLYRQTYPDKVVASGTEANLLFDLYYTSGKPIKRGEWIIIGHSEVSSDELAMSKRIVAGSVWMEDIYIGPASDSEIRDLPKMLDYGYRLIEKAAARYI